MIHIAIVDDKQPNRISLSEKFSFVGDMNVLFTAANGEDFLEQMKPLKQHPDVVLMDIDMPLMNGIEAVHNASGIYPYVKLVMLTVFDDDDKIFEAIKAGAIGCLLKDENVDRIMSAIREIIEFGGSPMSPRIARKALQLLMNAKSEQAQKQDSVLSTREMDILKELVEGLDYRGVAERLFISPYTVRTHITRIYQKLHVGSKTQAVMLVVKNRWFS